MRTNAKLDTLARTINNSASRGASAAPKLAATVVLVLAMFSLAAAEVPECVPGKLSDYAKLGTDGCLIGDKKFSNFSYHQGRDGLPSSSISVTPGTVPESEDAGLLFEAKWVAKASHESFVTYTLEVQPNGKPIKGASLQMQFGEITGTGKATVGTELCPLDGTFDSCGDQRLDLKVVLSSDGSKKAIDSGNFKTPMTAVRVSTPVDVVTGGGGTATLEGFMTVFAQ